MKLPRYFFDRLQSTKIKVIMIRPKHKLITPSSWKLVLLTCRFPISISFWLCNFCHSHTHFLFQLAISPSQPINNEPHSISVESQMALKIEGVICHGKDAQVFRKIKFITLLVEITSEERKESIDIKVTFPTGNLAGKKLPTGNLTIKQCFLVCQPLENMARKQNLVCQNKLT